MPRSWSAKDERQYKHIVRSCRKRRKALSTCKSIAAATVNKARAKRLGLCVCPKGYNKKGRMCVKRGRRAGPKTRRMICPTRRRKRR